MERKTQYKFGGVAFLAIGLWMTVSAADFHFKFSGSLNSAEAKVVSASLTKCAISDLCGKLHDYEAAYAIEFTTQNGQRVNAIWKTKEKTRTSLIKAGEIVTVQYQPTNPDQNYVSMAAGRDRSPHQQRNVFAGFAMLLVGSGFLAAGRFSA